MFAHNGNYLDPLETGDKDTVRFAIQYYKVCLNFISISFLVYLRTFKAQSEKSLRRELPSFYYLTQ